MENIFTHWESVINFTRNDIVFERHNKKYGAYAIRKYYPERLRNAFIYTLLGTALLFAIPLVLQKTNKVKPGDMKPSGEIITYFLTPITPEPIIVPSNPAPPVKQVPQEELVKFKIVENIDDKKLPDPPPDATENQAKTSNPDSSSMASNNSTEPINTGPVTPPPPSKPEIIVDEPPQFIGGDVALDKFLKSSIKYPRMAIDERISGKVFVTFVIDRSGKVKDAVIRRGGFGGGLEEEALRVVRLMPDWKPGKNRGYPVDVQVTLPINFVLN